ncbi:hypothetical protein C2E31_23035 [Rhodopirellula baltica]|nr:hypothetical protein C2E31_23035 [Rhodopirellula baltica]
MKQTEKTERSARRSVLRSTPVLVTALVLLVIVCGWFSFRYAMASYWAGLADHAIATTNYEHAATYYARADSYSRRGGKYLIGQARAARLLLQFDRAITLLDKLPPGGPEMENALRERLLAQVQAGEAKRLFGQFDMLLNQRSEDADAVWFAFADGFDNGGDAKAARNITTQWLARSPDSAFAHLCRGQLAYRDGDWETATQSFASALKLNNELKEAWQGLSRLSLSEYEYRRALTFTERVLEIDKRDLEANLRKANCLAILGESDAAIEIYEQIVLRQPNNFAARSDLAQLLVNQQYSQRAIDALESFFPEFSEDMAINYLVAEAYSQLGQLQKADEHLGVHLEGRKVTDSLTVAILKTPPSERDAAFCKATGMQYLRYQWDAAYDWLDQAVMMNPSDPEIHQALADFARKRGDVDLAEKYSQQAAILGSRTP